MASPVYRVLIADDVSPGCGALFKEDSRFEIREEKLRGAALIEAIPAFDGLIVRSGCKVTAEVLAQATRLRAIVRAGVGVDNIDVPEATRRGILVMNTPEGNTLAAAEHTVALMLALARNIPRADARVREGGWRSSEFLGCELNGKVLGVVGLGKIGRKVAERALSFGMTIVGYDPVMTEEFARRQHVELCELPELFRKADFITVHVPLTAKTTGLIDAAVLRTVRPGVRIINCARGGIIDEQALAEALAEKRIAGAALDVFVKEPLGPEHPLLACPRLVLTPHLGASTVEAQENVGLMSGAQLKAFLTRGEIRNSVNTIALDVHELADIEPYIELATRIGSLHAQLLEGKLRRIKVIAAGPIFESDSAMTSRTKVLTLSTLEGFFQHYLNAPVNRVSVPLFAREHGIGIDEALSSETDGFQNQLTVIVETDALQRRISGSLFGDRSPRLTRFEKYQLDATPEGLALMFKNYDQPGMLGQVAMLLGAANVNIANVNLGRDVSGGTALAFMNIDSEPPAETIEDLEQIAGVPWVRTVRF